jgi:hypothetical protein
VTGLCRKKETELPEWRAAIEALMLVVELGGPTMFAEIGVMRALPRARPQVLIQGVRELSSNPETFSQHKRPIGPAAIHTQVYNGDCR